MRILVLRSISFNDEMDVREINVLIDVCKSIGHEIAVYNMPACDEPNHWAAFCVVDYSNQCDVLLCIDFPTALIKHPNKRIILTKELVYDSRLAEAIECAISESASCYRLSRVDYPCELFPDDAIKVVL